MIADEPVVAQGSRPSVWAGARRALSPRNASALYVFVAIFVIFSIWVPDTFLAETTWRNSPRQLRRLGRMALGKASTPAMKELPAPG